MRRPDPKKLRVRGLVKVQYKFISSGGVIKTPPSVIVPLPMKEDFNANKTENLPQDLGTPVNTEKKILEKAKPSSQQLKTLKIKNQYIKDNRPEPYKKKPRKFLKSDFEDLL